MGGLKATQDSQEKINVLDSAWLQPFKGLLEKGEVRSEVNEIWVLLNVSVREHPVADPLISEVIYSQ